MDKETLKRVAKASHLALSEEELEIYSIDLGRLIDQLDILGGVPEDGPYSVNPVEIANILRDDVPHAFGDTYELLKDMKTYENYVRGPRLL